MARPKVYITGLPHSGTTWMWHVLRRFYDVGDELHFIQPQKGGEWKPGLEVATHFVEAMGKTVGPRVRGWNEIDPDTRLAALSSFRFELEGLPWPELVKLPDYGHQRLFEVVRPEYLVLTQRDPAGWVRSMQGNRHARDLTRKHGEEWLYRAYRVGIGEISATVLASRIPHSWVDFPYGARNWKHFWDRLEPLGVPYDDLYQAWREETHDKWLHSN